MLVRMMSENVKIKLSNNRTGETLKQANAEQRERNDPCIKEHSLSLKCLDETGYDRSKCEDFFLNYRNCLKFWGFVKKSRKKQGITPYLPEPNERDRVKEEYLKQMKF